MIHLYVVRHGLSEGNKAKVWSGSKHNTPLAPEGHEQAKATGKKLQQEGLSFDIIVSSPLDRAHHTAKHIAKAVGYPEEKILLNDLLVERGFGVIEGTHNPEISEKYTTDESILDEVEGAETIADLQLRAEQALAYLQSLPHETVLVVSHGNFARALRRAVNNDPTSVRGERIPNAHVVKLI